MQSYGAIESYSIQALASIFAKITCVYIRQHVYMAAYGDIYPYIQHTCTQEMHTITSQRIQSQKAGAHYTKLI